MNNTTKFNANITEVEETHTLSQIRLNVEKLVAARDSLNRTYQPVCDEMVANAQEMERLKGEIAKLQAELDELKARNQPLVDEFKAVWNNQLAPLNEQIKEQYAEIERLEREEKQSSHLKEAQKKVAEFKAQHSQHPAIMEFMSMVIERDIAWFKEQQALYIELGYTQYIKTDVSKSVKMFMSNYARNPHFDEFVIDLVLKETKARVEKLIAQVEKKVGNIQECKLEFNPNSGLDGLVIGDKAQAKVSTVLAGGYNIQRLHYRTLVKAV